MKLPHNGRQQFPNSETSVEDEEVEKTVQLYIKWNKKASAKNTN